MGARHHNGRFHKAAVSSSRTRTHARTRACTRTCTPTFLSIDFVFFVLNCCVIGIKISTDWLLYEPIFVCIIENHNYKTALTETFARFAFLFNRQCDDASNSHSNAWV